MLKKNKGKLGENLAVKYLQKKGLKLLKRNFHSRFGEIDLIFEDKDVLVFVEVKTRFNKKYGQPEDAVTPSKINNILKTGQYFKLLNPRLSSSLRIDVVSILLNPENCQKTIFKHFKNVTKFM